MPDESTCGGGRLARGCGGMVRQSRCQSRPATLQQLCGVPFLGAQSEYDWPELGGIWNRKVGSLASFPRYSDALKSSLAFLGNLTICWIVEQAPRIALGCRVNHLILDVFTSSNDFAGVLVKWLTFQPFRFNAIRKSCFFIDSSVVCWRSS